MADRKNQGGDLFIVDNSDMDWKVRTYLREWCGIAHSFDIATAYFEMGALLALDGEWQKLDKIRVLMGDEVASRTHRVILDGVQGALDASAAMAWRHVVADGQHPPLAVGFTGPERPVVTRVEWSNGIVWIDAAGHQKGSAEAIIGSVGFLGVPEEVWNFHIGGYQVCEKWLKDRRGRTLTAEDIAHYHRIVIALHETIRIMKQIDEVIDAYGGWPAAFGEKNLADGAS